MAKDIRIVKLRFFTYGKIVPNPYVQGQTRFVRVVAARGAEVDFAALVDVDKERALKFEAFYTEEELAARSNGGETPAEEEEGEEVVVAVTHSVASMTEWIKEDQPTIPDLLELANDDPALARLILEAENRATDNEPRKGLVEGLAKIINDAA